VVLSGPYELLIRYKSLFAFFSCYFEVKKASCVLVCYSIRSHVVCVCIFVFERHCRFRSPNQATAYKQNAEKKNDSTSTYWATEGHTQQSELDNKNPSHPLLN